MRPTHTRLIATIRPTTAPALFQCVKYKGETRCLNPCVQNQDCRHGRVCLRKCGQDSDCVPSGVCDTTDGQCHPRKGPRVTCADDSECAPGTCKITDPTADPPTGECHGAIDPNACNTQRDCLTGETCVDGQCEIQSLCADGPPLGADQCFPQLTSYQINVNAGFLVTGTQAGSYAAGKSGPNGCEPLSPSDRDQRLMSRIPLRPYPGQELSDILCDQRMKPVFPTLNHDGGTVRRRV